MLTQFTIEKIKRVVQEEESRITNNDFCGSISIKLNFLHGLVRTVETSINQHEQLKN